MELWAEAFAGHIASAGVSTIGYDIVADRMQGLEARGVKPSASPAGVVEVADVVITSLPSVKAFEAALFGDHGLISKARQGLPVVETSTLPLEAKENARARLAEKGVAMLDAPRQRNRSSGAAKRYSKPLGGYHVLPTSTW